ncbi:nicotinate-nucleotide adenylyltransferase (plasmid) [Legionella adelaidensis]|uniref:Probable nicotinate-nucleotide adenylyltransferase n=1 Tax=Legionella adelaidensis TaxID=45056 RepID=A0A0W0R495_9GAMM|nr:nicotinate-nucleotide adenylyltransferase [Legionella adelaidensis]KTC65867.1 nicotinate-nucleotide adenylyltransferase [Legionella adelaidensis]VEH85297.1 nicotinate-nucleotide adenylyltransferase [Legionella adelaidensis]
MKSIAVFGGSFDPPHLGHLHTALTIQNTFNFTRFLFMPCKNPVLKGASKANPQQRIKMLELLLAAYPFFEIDHREILREAPSYTVNTLESIREEVGDRSICFIMGWDAFRQLPQWHRWEKILTLCNILVMKRGKEDKKLPKEVDLLLSEYQAFTAENFKNNCCGNIILFDAGDYPVSSTIIRERIKAGKDVNNYLTDSVAEFIKQQELYR